MWLFLVSNFQGRICSFSPGNLRSPRPLLVISNSAPWSPCPLGESVHPYAAAAFLGRRLDAVAFLASSRWRPAATRRLHLLLLGLPRRLLDSAWSWTKNPPLLLGPSPFRRGRRSRRRFLGRSRRRGHFLDGARRRGRFLHPAWKKTKILGFCGSLASPDEHEMRSWVCSGCLLLLPYITVSAPHPCPYKRGSNVRPVKQNSQVQVYTNGNKSTCRGREKNVSNQQNVGVNTRIKNQHDESQSRSHSRGRRCAPAEPRTSRIGCRRCGTPNPTECRRDG